MKYANDLPVPVELADLCDRKSTALLIYDMQVGIRSRIVGGDRIVERCSVALSAARRFGMRVVFTRHLSCPKAWMGSTQYRSAMSWQKTSDPSAVKPWFLRDAPGTAIVPELLPTGHAEAGKRSMETMKFVGEAMITEVDTFAGLLARSQVM